MHILLTDRLACPRCGPAFGLILLADRLENRRVIDGRLGCSNCREMYPVAGGAADLRTGPTQPDPPATWSAEGRGEAAVRVAALLGMTAGAGPVLIAGPAAELAADVAALVPEVEVVALTARRVERTRDAVSEGPIGEADAAHGDRPAASDRGGVSPMAAGAVLPFQDHVMRGVALSGGADDARLAEALRVLVPGARLVVDPAPAGTAEALRGMGAGVLLEQDGVVVATAPGAPR
ncbi:MAG TPA: hypothetical protein VFH27_06265 [Longimicrobiaceae bacterium]|nr:hypothetical protein [Longimicrobiaceae bacterium]